MAFLTSVHALAKDIMVTCTINVGHAYPEKDAAKLLMWVASSVDRALNFISQELPKEGDDAPADLKALLKQAGIEGPIKLGDGNGTG